MFQSTENIFVIFSFWFICHCCHFSFSSLTYFKTFHRNYLLSAYVIIYFLCHIISLYTFFVVIIHFLCHNACHYILSCMTHVIYTFLYYKELHKVYCSVYTKLVLWTQCMENESFHCTLVMKSTWSIKGIIT